MGFIIFKTVVILGVLWFLFFLLWLVNGDGLNKKGRK
jgi:hypothetical protein